MNDRAIALACSALLCGGCLRTPPCDAAHAAATALDLACATAGVDLGDAELLVRCGAAALEAKRALIQSRCAKP